MIYPTISTGSCSSSLALLTLTRPGKNLVEELDISKSLGFAGSVSFCCVQYCPTRWWCPRSSVRSVGVYNPLFFVSDVVLGSGFLTTEIQKFRSSAASGCQDGGGRSCQEDSFKGLRWVVDVEGEIMMWKLGLYQLHEEKIETYAKTIEYTDSTWEPANTEGLDIAHDVKTHQICWSIDGWKRTRVHGQSLPVKCAWATSRSPQMDWSCVGLPSGKRLHSYWKWPFIVDLPIKNGDCP